jgi:hypothetical protein
MVKRLAVRKSSLLRATAVILGSLALTGCAVTPSGQVVMTPEGALIGAVVATGAAVAISNANRPQHNYYYTPPPRPRPYYNYYGPPPSYYHPHRPHWRR